MNDFLAKPFSFEQITRKVSEWTGVRPGASVPATDEPVRLAEAGVSGGFVQRSAKGDNEQQPDSPALDPAALKQLGARKKYRKRGLVSRVVRLYLEQTPKLLDELAQAIRQSDSEAQANIAHTLKSSSMTVGAKTLADTCREIEEASRKGGVETGVIDDFMQQYSAVEKELQDALAKES